MFVSKRKESIQMQDLISVKIPPAIIYILALRPPLDPTWLRHWSNVVDLRRTEHETIDEKWEEIKKYIIISTVIRRSPMRNILRVF